MWCVIQFSQERSASEETKCNWCLVENNWKILRADMFSYTLSISVFLTLKELCCGYYLRGKILRIFFIIRGHFEEKLPQLFLIIVLLLILGKLDVIWGKTWGIWFKLFLHKNWRLNWHKTSPLRNRLRCTRQSNNNAKITSVSTWLQFQQETIRTRTRMEREWALVKHPARPNKAWLCTTTKKPDNN